MNYIRLKAFYRPSLDNLMVSPTMFEEIGIDMTIFTKGVTAVYSTTLQDLSPGVYHRTKIKTNFTAISLENGTTVYTQMEELQVLLRIQGEKNE